MAFEVKAGFNYITRAAHKNPYAETKHYYSANVLKVGRSLVVYAVCDDEVQTNTVKVCTLSNFCKTHTDADVIDSLVGRKTKLSKRIILERCPGAAAAWE